MTKSILGPLPTSEEHNARSHRRRETLSEEHWCWVRDGDSIFINDVDEEVLRTGGPPVVGPSGRSHSPRPLHVPMPVPRFGRLLSVE